MYFESRLGKVYIPLWDKMRTIIILKLERLISTLYNTFECTKRKKPRHKPAGYGNLNGRCWIDGRSRCELGIHLGVRTSTVFSRRKLRENNVTKNTGKRFMRRKTSTGDGNVMRYRKENSFREFSSHSLSPRLERKMIKKVGENQISG